MSAEFVINGIVQAATLGKFGITKNPEFEAEWQKVLAEERSFMTRVYDTGTFIIIDDENHRILPKFNVVRKK